jgi:hypothetical protein
MERLDEKLPDFGHGFESAAAQRIGVHGNTAPANNAEALGVRGSFHGSAGFVNLGRRKKCEANGERLREFNSLLLSTCAEERLWERSEQAGAVSAGAVGVDAAAVGESL